MQIVSIGDNLHEISNPVFKVKYEKYSKMLSAENFTHSAKAFSLMVKICQTCCHSLNLAIITAYNFKY